MSNPIRQEGASMQRVIAAVQPNDAYYEDVLRAAHRVADGSPWRAVCIHPSPLDWVSDHARTPEDQTRSERRRIALAIEADLQRLGLTGCEVKVPVAQRGLVGDDVTDAAQAYDADLLVIGTHGRTGVAAFFMGSVAQRVVKHAHCDVWVVRRRPSSAG
jgi:nucleotide-binding universal stress UspA family protein